MPTQEDDKESQESHPATTERPGHERSSAPVLRSISAAARSIAAGCSKGAPSSDVWIIPGTFYGTTLRVFDPGLDAWHILWIDPVMQFYPRQIGRPHGKDIVQEGTNDTGAAIRWSFTEITPNSFHWLGQRSTDGRATWRLQAEFFARPVAA